MSGKKIIAGATEAVAAAKGEQPAAAILHNGHRYVPHHVAKERAALRKHLEDLTTTVGDVIHNFDVVARQPESVERGRTLARIINALEMANDRARHFGLGHALRKAGGCP